MNVAELIMIERLTFADSERALTLAREHLRSIVANQYIPQDFRRLACKELKDYLQELSDKLDDETAELPASQLPPHKLAPCE